MDTASPHQPLTHCSSSPHPRAGAACLVIAPCQMDTRILYPVIHMIIWHRSRRMLRSGPSQAVCLCQLYQVPRTVCAGHSRINMIMLLLVFVCLFLCTFRRARLRESIEQYRLLPPTNRPRTTQQQQRSRHPASQRAPTPHRTGDIVAVSERRRYSGRQLRCYGSLQHWPRCRWTSAARCAELQLRIQQRPPGTKQLWLSPRSQLWCE